MGSNRLNKLGEWYTIVFASFHTQRNHAFFHITVIDQQGNMKGSVDDVASVNARISTLGHHFEGEQKVTAGPTSCGMSSSPKRLRATLGMFSTCAGDGQAP